MGPTPSDPSGRSATWLRDWNPEDDSFWDHAGHRIARRNLMLSILSEHIGFSVWSVWSVLVLFMSPDIGFTFDAGEKFLLVSTPTLVGAILRLPYSHAVTRFGGRNWTIFSTSVLLVPATLAAIVIQIPSTPYWVFLLIAAVAGVGGANFASSMTNINAFYPQRQKGWALGLNAGGGNVGVAVVQLVGLVVISVVGSTSPAYVAAVYLPIIVVAAVAAAYGMDNVGVPSQGAAQREAARDRQTWVISFLYIGTFGSFIGYSFAFGLVLQTQFGFTALQAASLTFVGPLLGSLSRPFGGLLSDRVGGARVTLWTFVAMAAGTALLVAASDRASFGLFLGAFVVLFLLTGIGNGSTYKLIPVVFGERAEREIAAGTDPDTATVRERRLAGAVIGIAGAVGGLGGVFVNLAFRSAYAGPDASGTPAFAAFLAFYVVCAVVTWVVYVRRPAPAAVAGTEAVGA